MCIQIRPRKARNLCLGRVVVRWLQCRLVDDLEVGQQREQVSVLGKVHESLHELGYRLIMAEPLIPLAHKPGIASRPQESHLEFRIDRQAKAEKNHCGFGIDYLLDNLRSVSDGVVMRNATGDGFVKDVVISDRHIPCSLSHQEGLTHRFEGLRHHHSETLDFHARHHVQISSHNRPPPEQSHGARVFGIFDPGAHTEVEKKQMIRIAVAHDRRQVVCPPRVGDAKGQAITLLDMSCVQHPDQGVPRRWLLQPRQVQSDPRQQGWVGVHIIHGNFHHSNLVDSSWHVGREEACAHNSWWRYGNRAAD
mmetsp:Transcript_1492/g.3220  ORF Transcript_1492/g.3220 Transcript_1492/m.3220 type:complete len:307 (+) Transcript_1492:2699-3619(+)